MFTLGNPRTRRARAILWMAMQRFVQIDGAQMAAAFAYYAFFSLFPLIVLFVTIASGFISHDRATADIIAYVETYVPLGGDMQYYIFNTIAGVIKTRGQTGAVALVMLVWAALQFFNTLIHATTRASAEVDYNWWRLPLKSLAFLVIMVGGVLLGLALPILAAMAQARILPVSEAHYLLVALAGVLVPVFVMFLSLCLLYRLAPRRATEFAEVWVGALCATILLQGAEQVFVIYLTRFATLNAIYGAFGSIMALLLWINLSGAIIIFGACLCAAQVAAHTTAATTKQPTTRGIAP